MFVFFCVCCFVMLGWFFVSRWVVCGLFGVCALFVRFFDWCFWWFVLFVVVLGGYEFFFGCGCCLIVGVRAVRGFFVCCVLSVLYGFFFLDFCLFLFVV